MKALDAGEVADESRVEACEREARLKDAGVAVGLAHLSPCPSCGVGHDAEESCYVVVRDHVNCAPPSPVLSGELADAGEVPAVAAEDRNTPDADPLERGDVRVDPAPERVLGQRDGAWERKVVLREAGRQHGSHDDRDGEPFGNRVRERGGSQEVGA